MYTPTSVCRACGAPHLHPIMSLGATPLANSLLQEAIPGREPSYPLEVALCPSCSLVQLTGSVEPDILFEIYPYFSSTSDTMLRHAADLARQIIERRGLGSGSLVIEIASNDGYLLRWYRDAGIPVLGIDPARNIAAVAESRGIPTLCAFFGADLADALSAEGQAADVIHANNVLAHVPDLNGVLEGFRRLLKPDGVVIVETPYLLDMVANVEFDTIYHEHLCYFSLTALDHLARSHDLAVVDVERLTIHGGSIRVTLGHPPQAPSMAVQSLLTYEAQWGVADRASYDTFVRRTVELKHTLRALLDDLRRARRRIAAYGASAKGATLLNYVGIDRNTLEFVVDRSPHKQGRYMPGAHLEIRTPAALLEERPNYTLLLTWNFAEEILTQQAAYRAAGGRFIIPLPHVTIV